MLERKTPLNTIISRIIFGGTSRLRAYEATCFEWLKGAMSPEFGLVLDQQVSGVMTLQRFSSGKLVLFGSLQR